MNRLEKVRPIRVLACVYACSRVRACDACGRDFVLALFVVDRVPYAKGSHTKICVSCA